MNIIPLFGGIAFAGLGLFICFDYYRFNKTAIKTQGRILRYDEYQSRDSNGHRSTKYRPSFEFTVNGNRYEVRSKVAFSSQIIAADQLAEVWYQPGDEQHARLARGEGYGPGLLCIALSLPALYLGLLQ